MSIDQAILKDSDNPRPSAAQTQMVHLKLAERPDRDRIQRVVDLADALLSEAETLARDPGTRMRMISKRIALV